MPLTLGSTDIVVQVISALLCSYLDQVIGPLIGPAKMASYAGLNPNGGTGSLNWDVCCLRVPFGNLGVGLKRNRRPTAYKAY